MDTIFRLPPWRRSGPLMSSLGAQELDWGLRQFKIPDAWKRTRGAGVRVAVLDTGIDEAHQDLAGQVLTTRDFTRSPHGWNDIQMHGTHCAGVIAARENQQGMVGICPDLSEDGGGLIIGKVLGDDGSGRGQWVVDGIHWAIDQHAKVINLSLGSPFPDDPILCAIEQASASGCLVICAAGNDGQFGHDTVNYPARHAETIAVAAVGRDETIASFSSRGRAVDIAAPGENILSTVPGNRYVRLSGTSMATPFVVGVVALALSMGSIDSVHQLRKLLYDHAEDVGPAGKDASYGAGLIRADSMIIDRHTRAKTPSTEGLLIWIPGAEAR